MNQPISRPGGAPLDAEAFAAALSEHLLQGGTLGDLHGFSEQDYEAMYTVGHGMYSQQRYDDALKVFRLLVACDPMDRRFHQAVASSLQMTGEFELAIGSYSMASIMNINDPVPTFHTAECLAALGRVADAREALAIVIEQSSDPAYGPLRIRAEGLLTLLSRAAEPPATAPR